ncbi:transcriptional regulator, LacI family [Beutenbergia cavernae DSM 12333]|uniref:Transcriptional regulator, LacI family n=1 Tax=Beutenbergia cavernae (strain ATCC BAA-8 / DSM 12333 / CCUG 43141 / JCM 11478 / NBRC 16432 / NCIMB 13614 / HKI 0122) TaxID=471853 RepID=C5BVC6_BEUC1|nr:LacI family DNA-binding transcriptional regulator [Beutenbergia cavernae]ACQ80513.1 transcriptional regulator, LacI family [Beutenbergia cavernae DSM 12333]
MAVSMNDVARHAGVSQRTVSNVVTGSVNVAPATREKVLASIEALGYRPNVAAQRLRRGRTATVTLAVPSLHERYFADLAAAVVAEADRRDLKVLVETTDGDRENELALLRGGDLLTDGVIMSAVALTARDEAIRHPDYPLVLVGDRELYSQLDHVGTDNRGAAHAAVTHLLELGRRRIVLLGGRTGPSRTLELRMAGYRDALAEHQVAYDPDLVVACSWSHAAGEQAVRALLEQPGIAFDALFAMNDSAALGAIRALVRAGRTVPADVAVIGFDDIKEAQFSVPSLTSVGPAADDLAAAALDLLAAQLDGSQRVPAHHRTPFHLHVRESTGTPATA